MCIIYSYVCTQTNINTLYSTDLLCLIIYLYSERRRRNSLSFYISSVFSAFVFTLFCLCTRNQKLVSVFASFLVYLLQESTRAAWVTWSRQIIIEKSSKKMLLSSSVSFLISHCVCKCVRNDLQQTNWNVHSLAASINRIESNRCELNLKHDLLQLAALFPWIASHACSTTIYCRIVKKCSQRFFHRCVLENGLHLIQYRTLNLDDCIQIFNLRTIVWVCVFACVYANLDGCERVQVWFCTQFGINVIPFVLFILCALILTSHSSTCRGRGRVQGKKLRAMNHHVRSEWTEQKRTKNSSEKHTRKVTESKRVCSTLDIPFPSIVINAWSAKIRVCENDAVCVWVRVCVCAQSTRSIMPMFDANDWINIHNGY